MEHTVDMEILRAGSYSELEVSSKDLDQIVGAYDPDVHEAPLVLDHAPEGQEHMGPAYGWVESVRRVGDTLVARVKQIPEELAELIKSGRYKQRSVELWTNFRNTGRMYLKRVAMLGAAVPAVQGMAPITFAEDGGPSETVEFEEPQSTKEEKQMTVTYSEEQHRQLVEVHLDQFAHV